MYSVTFVNTLNYGRLEMWMDELDETITRLIREVATSGMWDNEGNFHITIDLTGEWVGM